MTTDTLPNPGSDEAYAQDCTCPYYDNGKGRGAWGTWDKPDAEKVFIYDVTCPLHGAAFTQALAEAKPTHW